MKQFIFFIFGTFIYLCFLFLIVVFCQLLPNTIVTNPKNLVDLIQIPKLVLWFISIVSGFSYCNTVSLGRPFLTSLQSRHNRYTDLIVVILFSCVVCLFTSNIVIYTNYDILNSECKKDNCNSIENKQIIINEIINWDVVYLNFFYYCLPFTVILNFFHIRKIKFFNNLIINTEIIKEWGRYEWLFFFFLCFCQMAFFAKMYYEYIYFYGIQIFYYYFYYLVIIILAIWLVSYWLKDTHFLHLHHYFITMIVLPFISVQNKTNLLFLGLATGLMVEGSAKWGIDAVWRKHHKRNTN